MGFLHKMQGIDFMIRPSSAEKCRFFKSSCLVANLIWLAAEPGFEPGLRDPKSLVLPLHNSASILDHLVPKAGIEPA